MTSKPKQTIAQQRGRMNRERKELSVACARCGGISQFKDGEDPFCRSCGDADRIYCPSCHVPIVRNGSEVRSNPDDHYLTAQYQPSLALGVHFDIPMSAYIDDPCERPSLSASGITRLLTLSPSAFAAHHPRLTRWPELLTETTDAADNGSAIHAILSGQGDAIVAASPGDFSTKAGKPAQTWAAAEAKAWWDAQIAAGRMPLDREDFARACQATQVAMEALATEFGEWPIGSPEVTIIWERDADPVPVLCRTRPDVIIFDRNTIIEIKTTKLALTDHNIQKLLVSKWAIQRALQVNGLRWSRMISPTADISHVIFVIEQNPPYDFCFVPENLSRSWMDTANQRIDRAANIFSKCLSEGKWPGRARYSTPEQPAYDLAEFESDEIAAMEEEA